MKRGRKSGSGTTIDTSSMTYQKRKEQARERLQNNPDSEWVEAVIIPGITQYELYGSDIRPILSEVDEDGNERTIEIPINHLEKELRCNSCLEIYEGTQLNQFCLHRNCKRCVVELCKRHEKVTPQCPQCRTQIHSKRTYVNDKLFDALIADIYPLEKRVDEIDDWQDQIDTKTREMMALHNERIAKMKAKRDEMIQNGEVVRDPAHHAAEAARAAQSTERSSTAMSKEASSSSSSSSVASNNDSMNMGSSREKRPFITDTKSRPMNFVLTPYNDDTESLQLARPYISVLCNTKVKSLKSYLHLKFPTVDANEYTFDISTFVDSERIVFEDIMMLREIAEKYWDRNIPDLRIYYSVVRLNGKPI